MRVVERPVHARVEQPAADALERVGGQAKAARHDRLLQQTEDGTHAAARACQRKQLDEGARRAVQRGALAPADLVGDAARGRRGAEQGVDERRRGLEIGRDDEDLVRRGRVVAGEEAEQAVLQHVELARERMADMDFDAAVVGRDRYALRRQVAHLEHGALQLGEQRRGAGVSLDGAVVEARILDAGLAAGIDEQREARLRLPAPGGEQSVADLVVSDSPRAAR